MSSATVQLDGIEREFMTGGAPLLVLKGIDLTIEPGEFVAIVGASGSGKSTLLNILGCLDRPTRGAYRLDGDDVARLDDRRLAAARNRKIGFVFQSFNLIASQTVLENVEVPLFYARMRAARRRSVSLEHLDAVGLSHRTGHFPTQLSGGECQRVAIARALVNQPSILLADEPTGNLDSKSGAEVMRIFQRLNESGMTIIMVTHNPEIAMSLPREVEISDGRIVRQRIGSAMNAVSGGAGDAS